MENNLPSLVDLLAYSSTKADEKTQLESDRYPLSPSAAGKCRRALFYDLQVFNGSKTIEKEPNTPETIRILALGHFIEDSLIQQFKSVEEHFGLKTKYRQQMVDIMTLPDGRIICGSTDFALEGPNNKILCDAKSSKDAFSAFYKNRWDENMNKWASFKSLKEIGTNSFYAEDPIALIEEFGGDFKTDNIIQVNLYLGSDFYKKRGFEQGSLLYYVKNDSRLFELRFKFSQELFDKTCDKFLSIFNAKTEEMAPKDFHYGSIRCAFCPYNKSCHTEDALKAYFGTLPNKSEMPTNISYLQDIDLKDKLESLFTEYINNIEYTERNKNVESSILSLLSANNLSRIRLSNGYVYEVKSYKTPKPRTELKRSK